MDLYNNFIKILDNDIIELLSIRQQYKINSKNLKVLELGGYNKTIESPISNIDFHIYHYESNNLSLYNKNIYKKLFNSNNFFTKPLYPESYSTYLYNQSHSFNLNRIIKQCYITFLYDLCEFGENENPEEVCDLDSSILFKLCDRVHFNYEIIKYKYINNTLFYNKIFKSNSDSEIIYYLSEFIKEPTYLENIYEVAKKNNIEPTLIQSLYKFYIMPFSIEIQYNFLNIFLNKII